MKDFVVYTAITDGYDILREPPRAWLAEAEFVAFLDTPQTVPGWTVRPIYHRFRDPCRNAKIHKIRPHVYFPKAKYSLWIDGSVKIKSLLPPSRWPAKYLREHDLAVFRHRTRNCIYQEGAVCIRDGLDPYAVIDRQMRKYFRQGYPANNGLAECTVLFRRHTAQIKRFNEAWYAEIRAYSRRDQLSFNYVAHQLGLEFNYLPGNMGANAHFDWLRHAKPRR